MRWFEQTCPNGWVYPCTLQDIKERFSRIPAEDSNGLWAIGLAASTRKNCGANGSYQKGEHPTIRIFSFSKSLRFKLPASFKVGDIELYLASEQRFGMQVEREGARIVCQWTPDALRSFILEHVLLHEIGHHVYSMRRKQQGLAALFPNHNESEQFAENYAVHCSKGNK